MKLKLISFLLGIIFLFPLTSKAQTIGDKKIGNRHYVYSRQELTSLSLLEKQVTLLLLFEGMVNELNLNVIYHEYTSSPKGDAVIFFRDFKKQDENIILTDYKLSITTYETILLIVKTKCSYQEYQQEMCMTKSHRYFSTFDVETPFDRL